MDHSHSIDIEVPAVSLEDGDSSDEESASVENEEAASLEDGVLVIEESTEALSYALPLANDENAVQLGNDEIVPLANEHHAGPDHLANQNNGVPLANQNAVPPAAYSAKEDFLVRDMREELNYLSKRRDQIISRRTIFRVPSNLRKNRELIEPSVVSIGPYHHGSKHLAPMEDKKWLLFQDALSQCNNNVTLEACVEKIRGLQLQARSCYSERVDMHDDSFVKMLILDGTFIIGFICQSLDWFSKEIGWASISINTDLILLENQIPFFVVQSLWDLYYPNKPLDPKKLQVIGRILCPNLTSKIPPNKFVHLLHLCHHNVIPDMYSMYANVIILPSCCDLLPCMKFKRENSQDFQKFPCATELEEVGIKLRKKKAPCRMIDVTFLGGMLEIPSIMISENFKTLYINLLAFEQCEAFYLPRHFTTYAKLMDGLIKTEHDVATLKKHGIIGNLLSDKDVVLFFSHLCDGAVLAKNHYLCSLFKEVNRYCCSKRQRFKGRLMQYRAKLMRDYFNSPWSLISFTAAVIILGLTFAQTYFAGYDHFNPSPK